MHYECEHGRRVIPRREGPEAFERCDECLARQAEGKDVRYRPVYAAGESDTVEEQLKATLLHALSYSRPFDWSE